MATKVKNWATGDGSVTLTYSGQGNGTITVESDMNTLDASRSMIISVSTRSITRNVTVYYGGPGQYDDMSVSLASVNNEIQ